MYEDQDQKLARIVLKSPEALSESDMAFLKARIDYLNETEKTKFFSTIGGSTVDIYALKRSELDKMAVELDLKPADYPNRKKLIEAIKVAREQVLEPVQEQKEEYPLA